VYVTASNPQRSHSTGPLFPVSDSNIEPLGGVGRHARDSFAGVSSRLLFDSMPLPIANVVGFPPKLPFVWQPPYSRVRAGRQVVFDVVEVGFSSFPVAGLLFLRRGNLMAFATAAIRLPKNFLPVSSHAQHSFGALFLLCSDLTADASAGPAFFWVFMFVFLGDVCVVSSFL